MINIVDNFEKIAQANASRIAIYDNGRSCSFEVLYDSALKLSLHINEMLAGGKCKIVGVLLPKSIESVLADLAILYSGNAYMNLDVNAPSKRTDAILEQTRPDLLIVAKGYALETDSPRIHLPETAPCILLPQEREQALGLRKDCVDADLACLINTSGSTGRPKAVALSHRGFLDFMHAVEAAGLMPEEAIIGSLSPIIFDIFSFELCMLAIRGSTLSLLQEKMAAFPIRLLQKMNETHVNFIFWVPTIMVNIANMNLLAKISLPDLQMVWFAGEVFPTAKFNYWKKYLPNVVFANFYGPIEITLDCLFYVVDRDLADDEPIPIGRPFKNTAILVLDGENQSICADSPNQEGELCVRGSSLAYGYYNDPQKTVLAFTQNPLNNSYPEVIYRTGDIVAWDRNGDLVFRGRKDTLIKRHGYRIELGEIEHAAIAIDGGVNNCCALYCPESQKIILAYESPKAIDERNFSKILSTILPRYMLPNEYRHLVEMPRNANGKIDRLKIHTLFAGERNS